MRLKNRKAHTLAELLIASVIVVLLTGSTLGAFIFVKQISATSIAQANLQRDANVIMKKITKGGRESGGIFRLSEAVSYSITGISELHFVGTDGIERWYYLNDTGTSILYHHPGFPSQDEVIYTAPQGAGITLRFWQPSGAIFTNIDVGIDVAVSQDILGKNCSGSAATIVNIRNHFV